MKALVTGGTGFVGPRLLRLLDKPTLLTRNPERTAEKFGHLAGDVIGWNPLEGPPPPQAFDGVDCVFILPVSPLLRALDSCTESQNKRQSCTRNKKPCYWHRTK